MRSLINVLTSGNDNYAEAAALFLKRYGEEAVAPLAELLDSSNPDKRWWALRALSELDTPKALELIHRALRDPEASVRSCAVLGLVNNPHPPAIPDLAVLLCESDRQLAGLARQALTALGGEAVPSLIEAAEGEHAGARLEAFRALAEIADQRAVPLFFKAVQDGDTRLIEYWAEIGLERLGFGMTYFKP